MSVAPNNGLAEQLSLESLYDDAAPLLVEDQRGNDLRHPSEPIASQPREFAPMLQLYLGFKQRYPEHIVLCQVGDFYEIFFDDASRASQILNIRLTSRDKEHPDPIPMCGVPIHALESYLPKLVAAGCSCVIVSQVEDSKNKKGMVQREITRIITPGVRFDGDGLDEKRFNYLAGLILGPRGTGAIAYTDVSTGVLRVQELESETELADALRRIQPSEVLFPSTDGQVPFDRTVKWFREASRLAKENDWAISLRPFHRPKKADLNERLRTLLPPTSVTAPSTQTESLSVEALQVVHAVLSYVEEVSFGSIPRLSTFVVDEPSKIVFIDAATRRNLELREARIDGDRRHSLLAHIDCTKTAMGSRLLGDWLFAPSSEHEEIIRRHDAVQELLDAPDALGRFRSLLAAVRDVDRLVSRISGFRAVPRDLGILRDSLSVFGELKQLMLGFSSPLLHELGSRFDPLEDVRERLTSSLVPEPPMRLSEGGIFREGFHEELDRLRALSNEGHGCLVELEQRERQRTGISGLKIRYNSVFGYFIEVSKANLGKVPADYTRKQTLANAERFVTEELKKFELSLLSAKARQLELERELFSELRTWLCEHVGRIQLCSCTLATLDVFGAFAEQARQQNYCRPVITTDRRLIIRAGRHPVVEQVIGAHNFIPNDTFLDDAARRFALLSGPNMGGKSTYLRQVGLIQLLAQAGSFVPASQAELGLVDRIFTRIGASDDLARGDSTFMVEMREAAVIARRATARSLVLIDEIGRGTATHDGLSIATALAEWLHDVVQCRTIFATHFHELTLLPQHKSGAFCLAVGVMEDGEDLIFTHRIEERAADRSFGIEVARLAGLPEGLVRRAKELLGNLLRNEAIQTETVRNGMSVEVTKPTVPAPPDTRSLALHELEQRLCELKINSMTPVQALVELTELQEIVSKVSRICP